MPVRRLAGNTTLKPSDHDCLQLITEDCVTEFHEAKTCPNMKYEFLPLEAKATLVCHARDTFNGLGKEIVISDRKIHTVVSLGDRYETDFEPDFLPEIAEIPAEQS